MATPLVPAAPRPPGPRGAPLVGSIFEMRRDHLGFFTRLAREYGDVAHFRLGRDDAYLISHPDLIKEVLVTQQHRFMKGRGLQWAKHFLGEGLLTSEGEFPSPAASAQPARLSSGTDPVLRKDDGGR